MSEFEVLAPDSIPRSSLQSFEEGGEEEAGEGGTKAQTVESGQVGVDLVVDMLALVVVEWEVVVEAGRREEVERTVCEDEEGGEVGERSAAHTPGSVFLKDHTPGWVVQLDSCHHHPNHHHHDHHHQRDGGEGWVHQPRPLGRGLRAQASGALVF